MRERKFLLLFALLVGLVVAGQALAQGSVSLKTVKDPGPNLLNEPMAKEFSLDKAVHFMDSAALNWQKQKNCFTCHTNYAYLYSRPMVPGESPALKEVRQFAEDLVTKQWPKKGPTYEADSVAMAMALVFHDAATTKKLHPVTKQAFDYMWKLQRPDGGWNWLKCDWPPMESDDHYGVTLAAIAVGAAPDQYAQSEPAKKGLAGIRKYLKDNPSPMVHHEAMVLWGASYLPDLMSEHDRKATMEKLFALQRPDGGWNLPSLGKWKRGDGKEQDLESSDGYATGFVIYVLRRAGVPAKDARLQKGIGWLKANQRESGRWFTRSPYRDNKHYITHVGTAFALMALAECGELPKVVKTKVK
jgi:squalene-hopene/tetraprenyl-beta-curcumene cyclase